MSGFAGRSSFLTDADGAFITSFQDESKDAFTRLRVSNNHLLLTSQQTFDSLPLVWDTELTGSASTLFLPDESTTSLIVTGDLGDKVIRQTKRYWLYRAGQGHNIHMTFGDGYQAAGIRKRVGYFDGYNGIFLEITENDIAVVLRSYTSGIVEERRITQKNWNFDHLDGTGRSGITLDLTSTQIFHIDFQWLGVGRVRTGFDIGGKTYYIHIFENANRYPSVYMSTATLPCRYEIEAVDDCLGGTLNHICSSVFREGGDEEEGIRTSATTGFAATTATTTQRSVLSLRLRSSHIRGFLQPINSLINNRGTESVRWDVVLNPTLDGTLSWINIGQSAQQSITQLNYTAGSGHRIASGYVNAAVGVVTNKQVANSDINSILGVAADIGGTSDVLSIIVESSTGSQTIDAILSFLELF